LVPSYVGRLRVARDVAARERHAVPTNNTPSLAALWQSPPVAKRILAVALVAFGLTACGGGGSSQTSATASPTLSAVASAKQACANYSNLGKSTGVDKAQVNAKLYIDATRLAADAARLDSTWASLHQALIDEVTAREAGLALVAKYQTQINANPSFVPPEPDLTTLHNTSNKIRSTHATIVAECQKASTGS